MTDDADVPGGDPTEPTPAAEQSVHKTDDSATSSEPEASPDDTPTAGSDEDSNATVQRSVQEETPAPPAQPASADPDSTPSPQHPDSQQPPSGQTHETSRVQRTPDHTDERHASPPTEDEKLHRFEDLNAIEEPAESATETDVEASAQDVISATKSTKPPTVHEERPPDEPRQPDATESPQKTHVPKDASEAAVQRRERTPESSETAEPAPDRTGIVDEADDIGRPSSPDEQTEQSSLQRAEGDASTSPPPAEVHDGTATDEGPTEPPSRDPIKAQREQGDGTEPAVAQSKETARESRPDDRVVQRTLDTSETRPIQQSEEPAERPERSAGINDTDVHDSDDSSALTSKSESEVTPQKYESDDGEPVDQLVPNSTTGKPAADELQIRRSHKDDAGIEPASTQDQQHQAEELGRPERTVAPDTPTPPGESPSAKPEASTEKESSSDKSSRVQPQRRDVPTSPESVQRAPERSGEHVDMETIQGDTRTPDANDEQSVVQSKGGASSTKPEGIQRETEHATRQMDSEKDDLPSTEPPRDTTIQRSPERDAPGDTTEQREVEAPPDVPIRRDAAQSKRDDDTPTLTSNDATSAEPVQRAASDEHPVVEERSKPSDDTPAPVADEPADHRATVEPAGPAAEPTSESATVQRTPDESTAIETSDVEREQNVTPKADAASEPVPATEQQVSQRETPASDTAGPAAQSKSDTSPANDVQAAEPQTDARVQRYVEDGSDSSATDSDATPVRRPGPKPSSKPASLPEETGLPGDDATRRTHIQRRPDDAWPHEESNAMPLPEPRPVPPEKSDPSDTSTERPIKSESGRDVPLPTSDRTMPGSESHDSAGIGRDTQNAIRRAPASDRSPEPATSGLEQTILSRAESHRRLPLAARQTIRRKPALSSEDPGISEPTQTLRRVRTQVQARRPHAMEPTEQSEQRTNELQPLPVESKRQTPVPETPQVAKTQSDSSGERPTRTEMQPAPQVSPPVFTPAARTSDAEAIQRTPLEFVQRVPPATGSEDRQESASETTSDSDEEEHDDQSEINLERLARDVYPLIKRMIAIERERRPGR